MTLGNVLTFISIIIAVFSFAFNSNRRIIFFKFTRKHLYVCILVILVISGLLMSDLLENQIPILKIFEVDQNWLPKPSQWAYIIAIIFLFYITYKSFFSKYIPNRNKLGLLEYYQDLIHENISLLIDYLRDYHSKEISDKIENLNNLHDEDKNVVTQMDEPEEDTTTFSSPSSLFDIIFNRSFIANSIDNNYELYFLESIVKLRNLRVDGFKDAVEFYYRTLLQESNNVIVEAINNTANESGDGITYRLYEYKFSELTFSDVSFPIELKVWHAFGEEGIRSASTNNIFKREHGEWSRAEFEKTPAYICIRFYDILIRQIISGVYKKQLVDEKALFIYPYYLYQVCEAAIVNAGTENFNKSYAEILLLEMRMCIYYLLNISLKFKVYIFVDALLNVLKSIVDLSHLSEENKIKFSQWMFEHFIDLLSKTSDESVKSQFLNILKELVNSKPIIMQKGFASIDTIKYFSYPDYNEIRKLIYVKNQNNE